jgi:hypothetical protein
VFVSERRSKEQLHTFRRPVDRAAGFMLSGDGMMLRGVIL